MLAWAARAGLSDQLVDSLRDNKPFADLSEDEAAVVNVGMEFFKTTGSARKPLTWASKLWSPGHGRIDHADGFYAMLAFNANAIDLGLPHPGEEPPLPVG